MTDKIRSRVFVHGDEKESSWPPLFGTGGAGFYHLDESGKLQEGPPPLRNVRYGDAPAVIQDTTDWHYHQAACRWTNSRSEIKQMDRATGTITTDGKESAEPYRKSREERVARERQKDIRESYKRAVAAIDSGNAPLSEETRAKCEHQNEIVSNALGFDAFNVAGKKDNGKGKRFRRK